MDSSTVEPKGDPPENPSPGLAGWIAILEFCLIVLVCFAFAGQPAPNVNETHYLTKAKQFWSPEWCSGDLFLTSSSPHLLFYVAFGWLTVFLPLTTVAWIGRIICWSLFAVAWQDLSSAAIKRKRLGVFSAVLFLLILDQCQLAGEWVIGGVESKSFAFPFVFWALAAVLRGQWKRVWILLGVASAFHVLVGGWSCLAAMITFVSGKVANEVRPDWKSQWFPLLIGGAISLLGILPPILANLTTDSATVHQANLILVTQRLGHHQWFVSFSTARIAWFTALVFSWLLIERFSATERLKPLRSFAVTSLAFCVIGIALSGQLELASNSRAADLLIYYWFRLSDFAVPLAATFMVLNLSEELRRRNFWTRAANTIFAVLLIAGFGFNCSERWKDKRPMAVQRSLYSYPGQPKRTQETYKNWKAVCLWVRENTHEHSVFLTPARQQTFKWFAERAEVVSWKDVPQDAQSVLEWYQRIQRLYRVELSYPGGLWAYTDEQLLEIAKETGATHLLTLQSDLDARALPPSGFQQIYPANPDTKATFVIFQLEE